MNDRPDPLIRIRAALTIIAANLIIVCAVFAGMAALAGVSSSAEFPLFTSAATPVVVRPGDRAALRREALEASAADFRERSQPGAQPAQPASGQYTSPEQMGSRYTFWVINREQGTRSPVAAQRVYESPRLLVWISEGHTHDREGIRAFAGAFEEKIYAASQRFFPTAASDGAAPLHVLYTAGLGSTTAGYFLPPGIDSASPRRLIYLNADQVRLGDSYTHGVLAHEYAHALLWESDPGEETWLAEGLAELNAFSAGFDVGSFRQEYLKHPATALNAWDAEQATPHYGAALLWMLYLRQTNGDTAIRALVSDPHRGLDGLEAALRGLPGNDPASFEIEDLFADWTAVNLINSGESGRGRFTYTGLEGLPIPTAAARVPYCGGNRIVRYVNQFGVDYIRLACPGTHTLRFEGSIQTPAFPLPAHSGNMMLSCSYARRQASLTHRFDLRAGDPAPLFTYWTWFDLARGSSYVFLLGSTDGERWQVINTPAGTAASSRYSWGYTGQSNPGSVWIQERIDLSAYRGRSLYLRFACHIDAEDHDALFLLDDPALGEAEYLSDLEQDDGEWQGEGFSRVTDTLPQPFRVTLVDRDEPSITALDLDADNTAETTIRVNDPYHPLYLLVSPVSRYTDQPGAYRVVFP